MKSSYVILLIIGAMSRLLFDLDFPFVLSICVAFTLFILDYKATWSHLSYYGLANLVTSVRLLLLVFLSLSIAFLDRYQVLFITVIPILDIVDGSIARSRGESSHFGLLYDLEVDALFVLVTAILIFEANPHLWFVLVPGLLRYGYKLLTHVADKKAAFVESKQSYASIIAGNYFIAVILFFILDNDFSSFYLLLSSALIVFSFAISFYQFYKWISVNPKMI